MALLILFLSPAKWAGAAHTDPFQVMKELSAPEVIYPGGPEPTFTGDPATASLKPPINQVFPEPVRPMIPKKNPVPVRLQLKSSSKASETTKLATQTVQTSKPPQAGTASSTGSGPLTSFLPRSAATATQTISSFPVTLASEKPPRDNPGKSLSASVSAAVVAKTQIQSVFSDSKALASASAHTPASSAVKAASAAASLKPPPALATPTVSSQQSATASVASVSTVQSTASEEQAEESGATETSDITDTGDSEATEEDPDKEKPVENLEEIVTEAEGFQKDGKWDNVLSALENAGTSKDRRVLELRLEALVNQKKVNSIMVKSTAESVLEIDQRSSIGNYGMGFYYAYARKPDLGKALTFLKKAKASRKPFPGTGSLYWQVYLKEKWWLILLLIGAGVAGYDKWRKKKKQQAEALAILGTSEPANPGGELSEGSETNQSVTPSPAETSVSETISVPENSADGISAPPLGKADEPEPDEGEKPR